MNLSSIASTFADLHAYHRWATRKLLALCERLTDEQLDSPQPMGLGSLRATLYHVWGAEFLWLARWKGESPTSFPADKTISIAELTRKFAETDEERESFLQGEEATGYSRVIAYRNLAGDGFSNPLAVLMLHVVNHGVHHRAQALQFLKLAGVTVPGGLDYIFYRLAVPSVESPLASREAFRGFGLEMGDSLVPPIDHSPEIIRMYSQYSDWGMRRLFDLAVSMADSELDRDFGMGMGTLRKTLLHVYDVERWWQGNWRGEKRAFDQLPTDTAIADLRDRWNETAETRNEIIEQSDDESLKRVVEGDFGAGPISLRVGETLLQLGVHGTHHRAQAINMLRRLGVETTHFDLVVWIRDAK